MSPKTLQADIILLCPQYNRWAYRLRLSNILILHSSFRPDLSPDVHSPGQASLYLPKNTCVEQPILVFPKKPLNTCSFYTVTLRMLTPTKMKMRIYMQDKTIFRIRVQMGIGIYSFKERYTRQNQRCLLRHMHGKMQGHLFSPLDISTTVTLHFEKKTSKMPEDN